MNEADTMPEETKVKYVVVKELWSSSSALQPWSVHLVRYMPSLELLKAWKQDACNASVNPFFMSLIVITSSQGKSEETTVNKWMALELMIDDGTYICTRDTIYNCRASSSCVVALAQHLVRMAVLRNSRGGPGCTQRNTHFWALNFLGRYFVFQIRLWRKKNKPPFWIHRRLFFL